MFRSPKSKASTSTLNEPISSPDENLEELRQARKRARESDSPPDVSKSSSSLEGKISKLRSQWNRVEGDFKRSIINKEGGFNSAQQSTLFTYLSAFTELFTEQTILLGKQRAKEEILDEIKSFLQLPEPSMKVHPKAVTFSDILKSKKRNVEEDIISTTQVVIVKPEVSNDKVINSEDTKKLLSENVNPSDEGFQVVRMKKARNKGVILEMPGNTDIQKVSHLPKLKELGLNAEIPGKRKPLIITFSIPAEMTEDSFLQDLQSQNMKDIPLEDLKKDIKLKFKTGKKGLTFNHWVLEVTPKIRKTLTEKGRIFIKWGSYSVEDFTRVTRCFKCQGLGHSSKSCKLKITCGHCAEEGHDFKSCSKKEDSPCCINCKRAGQSGLHSVKDEQCPAYQHALRTLVQRTDYCLED